MVAKMFQTASVMLKDRRTAIFTCCGKLLVFAQTLSWNADML